VKFRVYCQGPNSKLVFDGRLILNKRESWMIFRDLRFNLEILIFGSGTKVTIFYFHFGLCDTSYSFSA